MLVDAWETMLLDLEHFQGTKWDYGRASRAEYLLGHDPMAMMISRYLNWTQALHGNFANFKPGDFPEEMTRQEKQDHALGQLHDLVTADLAAIRAHRATMDTTAHDAELAHAADVALFDPSKEAILAGNTRPPRSGASSAASRS